MNSQDNNKKIHEKIVTLLKDESTRRIKYGEWDKVDTIEMECCKE